MSRRHVQPGPRRLDTNGPGWLPHLLKPLGIASITLLLSLLHGSFLTAAAAGTRILTLDEALAIAMERNHDIQKAREYRNMVTGRYVEERAAALPNLTLNSSVTWEEDKSINREIIFPSRIDRRSGSVEVSQVLFAWGKVSAAIDAAREGLKTADDQLRLYRQAACKDVSVAFYNVILARELVELSRQNLDQKIRHYDEAKRKFTAGTATDYDVLAAEVAVANARPEVIRTENDVRTTRDQLRFLLGVDEEIDVTGALDATVILPPPYDEVLEVAIRNRPELSDLRHRQYVNEQLVKIADAGDKPRIDLKAGIGYRQTEMLSMTGDGVIWSAGVYLSWPFFDGLKARGKVTQAESDLTTSKIEELKLVDSISLQARQAINAVNESAEIVIALTGTVAQAERLLKMAEKGYELGVKISLEVDDAQLNLLQAKLNQARARREYLSAWVNLRWVMGVVGETHQTK